MVKNRWERLVRALHPLESGWAELSTFDVEDAVEELIMCRRSGAQRVVMENPQRSGATLGRTRNSLAREYASQIISEELHCVGLDYS